MGGLEQDNFLKPNLSCRVAMQIKDSSQLLGRRDHVFPFVMFLTIDELPSVCVIVFYSLTHLSKYPYRSVLGSECCEPGGVTGKEFAVLAHGVALCVARGC